MTDQPVLVIGYGNSLRRDDGAGLILAAALVDAWQGHGRPATLLTEHQLVPELSSEIAHSNATVIVFVDARDAAADEGAQVEVAAISTAGDALSPSLGHQLTPRAVLLYARQLFGWKGSGWVISIPGVDFDHGEGLASPTQLLVDDSVCRANTLWRTLQEASQVCD